LVCKHWRNIPKMVMLAELNVSDFLATLVAKMYA